MNKTNLALAAFIGSILVLVGILIALSIVLSHPKPEPVPVKVPPAPVIEIVTPGTSDTIDDILDVNP